MDNTQILASGDENTKILSRSSITACLRCREQKVTTCPSRCQKQLLLKANDSQLKCGRERPTCTRCERLSATCNYPRPPNRRGPRGQRAARLLHENSRGEHFLRQHLGIQRRRNETVSQQTSVAEAQKISPISGHHTSSSFGPNGLREDDTLLPSSAGLVDTSAAQGIGTPAPPNVCAPLKLLSNS